MPARISTVVPAAGACSGRTWPPEEAPHTLGAGQAWTRLSPTGNSWVPRDQWLNVFHYSELFSCWLPRLSFPGPSSSFSLQSLCYDSAPVWCPGDGVTLCALGAGEMILLVLVAEHCLPPPGANSWPRRCSAPFYLLCPTCPVSCPCFSVFEDLRSLFIRERRTPLPWPRQPQSSPEPMFRLVVGPGGSCDQSRSSGCRSPDTPSPGQIS